jgi:hypothetical protein
VGAPRDEIKGMRPAQLVATYAAVMERYRCRGHGKNP